MSSEYMLSIQCSHLVYFSRFRFAKSPANTNIKTTHQDGRGAWRGGAGPGPCSPQLGAVILTGKAASLGKTINNGVRPPQSDLISYRYIWKPNLRHPSFWSSSRWAYANSIHVTGRQSTLEKDQSWAVSLLERGKVLSRCDLPSHIRISRMLLFVQWRGRFPIRFCLRVETHSEDVLMSHLHISVVCGAPPRCQALSSPGFFSGSSKLTETWSTVTVYIRSHETMFNNVFI